MYCRFYASCGKPKPWEQDKMKAYAICPWFADTDLPKETITVNKLEKKSGFRVLTVKEVGDAFENALAADDNGSVWVAFPDVPTIKYPEMGIFFLLPIIAYGKVMALCRPEWKRINGMYGIIFSLLVFLLLLYLLICIIF